MSIFLITVLSLLLAGAVVTYLLAGRPGKEANTWATAVLAIILAGWILANRFLPLSMVLAGWSLGDTTSQWVLLVDEFNWGITFYFLLLVEAWLLTQARSNFIRTTGDQSPGQRFFLPLILLLTAVVLLAIWSTSLAGLITSWTLLAIFWLALFWSFQGAAVDPQKLIGRFGLLLLSVAFLGLAAATSDPSSELALTGESWPATALLFISLAVLTQMGAIPLHWWRPLKLPLNPAKAVFVHLLPGVAGAALLARLALIDGAQITIAPLLTILGWLGLLFGAYLAWVHLRQPVQSVTGLAIAQVGLMAIVAGWASAHSVVASTRVLVLALGSLYLVIGLPRQRFPWYVVVPVAALAGLPLTAGFSGLAPLYSTWFSSGRFGLAIITGLSIVPVIAAAVQVSGLVMKGDRQETLDSGDRILLNLGLLLPTLGLLVVPGSALADIPLVTWLFVLLIVGASIVLGRYGGQLQPRLFQYSQRFHAGQIVNRVGTIMAKLAHGLSIAIRGTAGILEGEGGLLWLLVLAVIIWLAQRG